MTCDVPNLQRNTETVFPGIFKLSYCGKKTDRLVTGNYFFFHTLVKNRKTALVTRMQKKQLQLHLATYVRVNWSFFTLLNLHMIRKSNIVPERSLLPAPALPPLLLHVIDLSGGCGGYGGTVQC